LKMENKKIVASLIAIILMLTITISFVALPLTTAHYPPWTVVDYCYIAVTNSIIGVGQQENIIFWSNNYPPTATGDYGDRFIFYVDIMKPSGTNDSLGPIKSDPIGGGYALYTPTEVGTYTFVARQAQQVMTGLPLAPASVGQSLTYVNDTFTAATSSAITVTVQQEPIAEWQEPPLPSAYWTRPINDLNRNWYTIAGNWLSGAAQTVGATNNFAYGKAPESAHVMWTRPMWAGGIMDARFGDIGYQTFHYEGLGFAPPIIMNGKLYYNVPSLPKEGWYCVDLYTGKTDYFFNTTGSISAPSQSSSGSIPGQSLAFGQILNYESPNQHGGFPYLWSTSAATANTWMMYDAFTGNYMCSIANVSSGGTAVYGKDGSILRYNIVNYGTTASPRYYLTVWNTTQAIWWRGTSDMYQNRDYSGFTANNYWMWRPGLNVTYNGNNGFSLNASIPAVQGSIYCVREDQFVIGGTQGKNDPSGTVQGNLWALNLKPDSSGIITPTLLWNITFTPPYSDTATSTVYSTRGTMAIGSGAYGVPIDPEDGVFIFAQGLTRQLWGYSLETGQPLWGPTEPVADLDFYGMMYNIYQGKIIELSYGGVLNAYDVKTGEKLWNYTCAQVGFESPYGNYPSAISCVADGKIYIGCGEHSPSQPLWRGPNLRCINASNGAELWKIMDFGVNMAAGGNGGSNAIIGDGFLVALNAYDNQLYCIGQGPCKTTVTAPNIGVSTSTPVVISGTITDICAGTTQNAQAATFPNGVPCVSDASQEAWMEYVYEQQAKPTNATGVLMKIDVVDSNGNLRPIGTTTSDTSGTYALTWTPDIAGDYTVIATFAGSASYYPSSAEAHFTAIDTAPTASPYPAVIIPPTEMYVTGAAVAIIIAIAIVGVVLLMAIRKRP
jgi:hypothetical protein